jgi:hypothetical protein
MQVNKVFGVGIAVSILIAISMVCSAEEGKVHPLGFVEQDWRQQSKDDDIQQASSKGQEEEEGSLLPFLVRRKRRKLAVCNVRGRSTWLIFSFSAAQ